MGKFWSILLLSIVMCGTLHAQHYLGVRGGWGGGSARFTPARETKLEWGLYSGGLSYKFYTAQKYVGGIQIDLQYMGRGFAYDLQSKSDSSYHRTINSFELPFYVATPYLCFPAARPDLSEFGGLSVLHGWVGILL